MLTGKDLGAAIAAAIELKKNSGAIRSQADVARHFKIKPPSISDWKTRGTIEKDKLQELFDYFSDVVGPDHWGLTNKEWLVSKKHPEKKYGRKLVQRLCDIAETINDLGLMYLIGKAEEVAKTEPLAAKITVKPRDIDDGMARPNDTNVIVG